MNEQNTDSCISAISIGISLFIACAIGEFVLGSAGLDNGLYPGYNFIGGVLSGIGAIFLGFGIYSLAKRWRKP